MVQSGTATITVVAATNVISRASGNFITDGFEAGNTVTIYGSSNNTGTYTVTQVNALYLLVSQTLTDESAFSGVVLSAGNVIWNTTTVNENIRSDATSGIQHMVYLNTRGRNNDTSGKTFETNRIGLKAETVSVTTSKTVPALPIPGVGAITGEAQTIALDLGMTNKSINISGLITDQFITKSFAGNDKSSWDTLSKEPSVYMTAHEIAQLIHTNTDSSALQSHQNMNELIILMPSRVNGFYDYHSVLNESTVPNPTEFTDTADLPLIPFNFKSRVQDNKGTIFSLFPDSNGLPYSNFPKPIHIANDVKGIKGFIRSFNCTFQAGQPFITFSLDFEVAFTIG